MMASGERMTAEKQRNQRLLTGLAAASPSAGTRFRASSFICYTALVGRAGMQRLAQLGLQETWRGVLFNR